jgi:hypothetical protein
MENSLFTRQKKKLAKKVEPFPIKNGVMYRMRPENRLKWCLSTTKAKMVTKELHEGTTIGHCVTKITQKKILDVGY